MRIAFLVTLALLVVALSASIEILSQQPDDARLDPVNLAGSLR